jgi:hypothetical protein
MTQIAPQFSRLGGCNLDSVIQSSLNVPNIHVLSLDPVTHCLILWGILANTGALLESVAYTRARASFALTLRAITRFWGGGFSQHSDYQSGPSSPSNSLVLLQSTRSSRKLHRM